MLIFALHPYTLINRSVKSCTVHKLNRNVVRENWLFWAMLLRMNIKARFANLHPIQVKLHIHCVCLSFEADMFAITFLRIDLQHIKAESVKSISFFWVIQVYRPIAWEKAMELKVIKSIA